MQSKFVLAGIIAILYLAAASLAGYGALNAVPYRPGDLTYWEVVPTQSLDTRERILEQQLEGTLKLLRYSQLNFKWREDLFLKEIEASFSLERDSFFEIRIHTPENHFFRLRFVSPNASGDKSALLSEFPEGNLTELRVYPVELMPRKTHFVSVKQQEGKIIVNLNGKEFTPINEFNAISFVGFASGMGEIYINNLKLLGKLQEKEFFLDEDFTSIYVSFSYHIISTAIMLFILILLTLFLKSVCKLSLKEASVSMLVATLPLFFFSLTSFASAGIWFFIFCVAIFINFRKRFVLSLFSRYEPKKATVPIALVSVYFVILLLTFAGPVRESFSTEKVYLAVDPETMPGEKKLTFSDHIHIKGNQFRNARITFDFKLENESGFDVFFRRHKKIITIFTFNLFINRELVDWYSIRAASDERLRPGFYASWLSEPPVLAQTVSPEAWHALAVEIIDDRFSVSIDGKPYLSFTDDTLEWGESGVVLINGGATIKDFKLLPLPGEVPQRGVAESFFAALISLLMLTAMALINMWLLGISLRSRETLKTFSFLAYGMLPAFVFIAISYFIAFPFSMTLILLFSLIYYLFLLLFYVVLNIERLKYPTIAILLFAVYSFASAEAVARQTLYDIKWRDDFLSGFVRDEFLDWKMEPGSRVWESYINSFGFRGAEVREEKSEGTIRIICLGASSTFGDGLAKTEDTYPYQLERLLNTRFPNNRFEVINAGVSAYSSFQGVIYLETKLLKFKPDIVIFNFGNNDNNDALLSIGRKSDAEHFAEKQRLRETRSAPLAKIFELSRKSRILTGLRKWRLESQKGSESIPRVSPEEYRQNLEKLIALGKKHNFTPVIMKEITNDFESNSPFLKRFYEVADELAKEKGVAVVDNQKIFKENKNKQLFIDFVHPTGLGNKLIAENVANAIGKIIEKRISKP
ncbi:MAG: hypothetical protein Kow0090_12100 [Myxococcota bacterium]